MILTYKSECQCIVFQKYPLLPKACSCQEARLSSDVCGSRITEAGVGLAEVWDFCLWGKGMDGDLGSCEGYFTSNY